MTVSILEGLNTAQQQAVQVVDGPTLVLAGPGSGKTGVLVRRVAFLSDHVGIDLHNVLAVTFTNKAAREMRERIDALLGAGRAAALTAGTFHSLCARFLRRDIVHLSRERDFAIYDTDDQERLMKRVLKDLNLDDKKYPPRAIRASISSAKNELIDANQYAQQGRTYYDEIVARCFVHYQKLLREANALDFDDLLVETVRLFEQHPAVLEKYQTRYRYILADEYQDTNHVQYMLLKQLASKYRNLFVVGDEDQSVYAFRGADIRNIRYFENDYPEAKVILLEQNYRSTQSILDVAQSVINQSAKRMRDKNLWTENDRGTLVVLQEGYDQDEESYLVASEAARLLSSGDYQPGDIAVMYRTNAQSRALEEALIGRGLRYQIVGGTRFYERKEIKDALAYLRVAHNPADNVSLSRILNWPGRGIGQRTEDELGRWATKLGVPVYRALQKLKNPGGEELPPDTPIPFNARTQKALLSFMGLIDSFIAARHEHDLGGLMDVIFRTLEFESILIREHGEEEGRDRWNNVVELRNVAANYIHMPQESQLPTFLEEVALVSDLDSVRREQDTITCITLHQAKGLEYPVVFLIGLEEGLLPHSRSLDHMDALDEERRLFYVGATRAKERLYMLYAFRRTVFGRTNVSQSSRFLADIPKELLHHMPKRGYTDTQQTSMFTNRSSVNWTGSSTRQTHTEPSNATRGQEKQRTSLTANQPQAVAFFAGQKVNHAMFGEGMVVSSKLIENDEEVTVAFPGKGVKKLLASFANLERIE
ncbi:MAG: DNA helicase UvrD [Chloroflexi bacterium AL-W]|nr:DNA helicase UvrD [Chloroflexi bacterium AL-N1]NOK69375.1 DNA helicase UvrD [Chloroflexi bacterium AL-N10]NOK76436.1 DNA helicase UvrD [Chloroflexi bacterium AL-N5]NOK83553.1 DNA helicase UvrD [Chloroflexi bacterium AL-W]NOK91213.1 DNA helicase UvrD [Chloroflexi bacterium AL-N15]